MLMHIRGSVLDKGADWLLVDVNGLGYRVGTSVDAARGSEIALWTHEVIRDDHRELFGFKSREALELFWKLIGVNGVGPKVGQKILASCSVAEIRQHVMGGDVTFLTKVPGVGKKTAQKIILELQGSLVLDKEKQQEESTDLQLVDALTSLGYQNGDAKAIAAQVSPDLQTMEEKLKAALQMMV